jgi:hypothetical protein
MRVASFAWTVLAFAAFAADLARAQVAIAPLVQADDAVHRDIVSEIALALLAEHEPLMPQLQSKDIAPCRDDVACVLRVARERGASHLVRVSVAPLGARDQVVAVALYSVRDSAKLFEENTVLSTTRDVRVDARSLGDRVAAIDGLPARRVVEDTPPAMATGPGAPSFVGAGLVLGGALAAVGTGVGSSLMLADTNPSPQTVGPVIVAGSAVTTGLVIGGVLLLALDEGEPAEGAPASER